LDASDFGFGETIKAVEKPPFELVGSLSEKEMAMSSTAREMLGFFRILQQAGGQVSELLKEAAVLVIGDNQGAIAALNKFSSTAPDVAASLREIFALCSMLDFDVVAQWEPMEEVTMEDTLSRVLDASDWGLAPRALAHIIDAFGTPVTDLFAFDLWHVTPRSSRPACRRTQLGLAGHCSRRQSSMDLSPSPGYSQGDPAP
jgi:hypothetical protein